MEFAEVVRRRRMTRSFDGRPVAAPALERVLDATRRGPSAGFSQGLDLLVLVGPEQTQRYWETSFPDPAGRARFRWPGLFAAPVLILPLISSAAYLDRYREPDKAVTARTELAGWPVPYWWVDGGMAVMLALLVGGTTSGVFGLLIAVPAAAVLKILVSHLWHTYVLGEPLEVVIARAEEAEAAPATAGLLRKVVSEPEPDPDETVASEPAGTS